MNRSAIAGVALSVLPLVSCANGTAAIPSPQAPPGEAWLSPKQIEDANIHLDAVGEREVGSILVTSGRVTFDDTRVTHVFSPVTGRVVKVLAQLGERVAPSTPLALLASPDLAQAFSDLLKARADFDAARSEFERQKELFESHAGARRDLETAEENFLKTQAEVERARQKTALLAPEGGEEVRQEYTLHSRIQGEVIARNVNPGTEVQGQYSTGNAVELFTIGELDRVWVLADVYEVDLARIKKGAPVTVKVVSYPEQPFRGTVDWISDALDPASHTAKVRCVIANPNRELKPEMFVTVSLSTDMHQALAVPRTALVKLGDQTVVFVQKGQSPQGLLQFERRPLRVDEDAGDDFVPVTKGLAAGERIVTTGAILLAGMV